MLRLLDRTLGAQHPVDVKVPRQITFLFWGTKIASTAFGRAFADWLDGASSVLVAAVGCLAALAVFLFALRRQLARSGYDLVTYWFAVAMAATFGTMLADVVHQFTGAPYWSTSLLYGALLGVVLWRWWASERTRRCTASIRGDANASTGPRCSPPSRWAPQSVIGPQPGST